MFAVADDPNAYVAWTVQRDGLLRMRTSSNVRHVGPDPNDPLSLASFTYDRAVRGLPESETVTPLLSPAQPRRFDYDPLDRLVRVTYGTDPNRAPDPNTDPYESFALDLAGNRIDYEDRQGNTTHYEPNAGNVSNQYTEITPGVDEPNYDPAGNLITDHRGYEYFYDHDNHLTGVRKSITALATFEYDALGRRIFMTDWTATPIEYRQYIYSGQNVVEEYDLPQHRACYYVHGPSYIDERVLMHDEASEADYVYLLKDLYTVAGLADARGWLVEAYDYDAYGKVTIRRCAVLPDAADYDADGDVDDADLAVFDAHQNGPGNDPCDIEDPSFIPGWRSDFDGDGDVDGVDYIVFAHAYGGAGVSPRGERMLLSGPMPTSRVANPYFFTGRRLDLLDLDDANTPNHFTDDTARLPLYHYPRRTMDPIVGRFAQRDPLGYVERMNPYEYCPVSLDAPHGQLVGEDVSRKGGGLTPDPCRDPDTRGYAWCDESTGGMNMKVCPGREFCKGNCVEQHEKQHVRDMDSCCKRKIKCIREKKAPERLCRAAYSSWFDGVDDWTECRAYRTMYRCLRDLLFWRGGSLTPSCCKELETAKYGALAAVWRRCYPPGTPYRYRCPFDGSGRIRKDVIIGKLPPGHPKRGF